MVVGGGGFLFLFLLYFFTFFFNCMQVWEILGDDNWHFVDVAWWPYEELSKWRQRCDQEWETYGEFWEERVGREECNVSLNACALMCRTFMKLRFTCDDGSVISHLPHLNGGCTVSPAFFSSSLFYLIPFVCLCRWAT